MTTADQLAARAMALAAGACDDDLAVAELCRLADGDDHALDQAILACLAQPASLAARHLAIELLARALYELLAAAHHCHGQVRPCIQADATHQIDVGDGDFVVLSFRTVPQDELLEVTETGQRRY
jgi:hypothetical protein